MDSIHTHTGSGELSHRPAGAVLAPADCTLDHSIKMHQCPWERRKRSCPPPIHSRPHNPVTQHPCMFQISGEWQARVPGLFKGKHSVPFMLSGS